MDTRKPILPPGAERPTPLGEDEIASLVNWVAALDDPYMLAYCLHWGLGAAPELIQAYTGFGDVRRKIGAFPNKCRRHLRKGTATVIGFDDLHRVFSRALERDFELLLLRPTGAFCIHKSNHMAYLDSIFKLYEQRRLSEIIDLNRKPYRKTFCISLPDDVELPVDELCELILELPEEYEAVLWMYFVEQKSVSNIYHMLETRYIQGIIEYGRRLMSRQLGYNDPLDDAGIRTILLAL